MIQFEINKRLAQDYIRSDSLLSVSKRLITKDIAFHTHDFFEIELILSGNGVQQLNGSEYELKPGTLYLLTPLDYHQISIKEPIELYSIKLCENVLPVNLLDLILSSENNITFSDEALYKKAQYFCELLYDEYTNKAYEPKYVANIVECLFILLVRHFEKLTDSKTLVYKPLQKAVIYMQLHFQEDPSVQKTAEEVYMSTNYFSSLFRRKLGKTYSEYLTELKLNYAKKLLLTTDLSITDICFSSGFLSVSNFLKVFKSNSGCSPNKFRKDTAFSTLYTKNHS